MNVVDMRAYGRLTYDYCCEEGIDRCQFQMHIHDQMELYYLLAGNVEYRVENHIYRLNAGDIMLMRPGELHTSLPEPGPEGVYERYNLRFSPELLTQSLNTRLLGPFLDRPNGVGNHYSAREIPSEYIRECFRRMFALREEDEGVRAVSYLIPILQELYDVWVRRESTLEQEKHRDPLAVKIISYINQHLDTIRSPRELTEVFYLSQSQIYRAFHRYTGTSVWDYIRTKRLIIARERMRNGEKPTKAAAACGFSDYSTFYRAYKRQFQCSPQDDYQTGGK